jgi:hypothetical protein
VVEAAIGDTYPDLIAAAGGSAAAGASGGGALGSIEPGGGTIVGAAAGLLAGMAVDAWITHETKQRTIAEVESSLTQIETSIISGDGKNPGLDKVFHQAVVSQIELLNTKLHESVQEAVK